MDVVGRHGTNFTLIMIPRQNLHMGHHLRPPWCWESIKQGPPPHMNQWGRENRTQLRKRERERENTLRKPGWRSESVGEMIRIKMIQRRNCFFYSCINLTVRLKKTMEISVKVHVHCVMYLSMFTNKKILKKTSPTYPPPPWLCVMYEKE